MSFDKFYLLTIILLPHRFNVKLKVIFHRRFFPPAAA
jgi:hypothetical protein